MITDYFKPTNNVQQPIVTQYYELHRSFIERNIFGKLYDELRDHLQINASRKSCVCVNHELKETFDIYHLPLIDWTVTSNKIRNKIVAHCGDMHAIDYGLVHYYADSNATISWHHDKEALNSNVYLVSVGGTRSFCLRDKETRQVLTFHLFDGDLFIMKTGCQDKYEHCIKSVKLFNEPRISVTFRQMEPCNNELTDVTPK